MQKFYALISAFITAAVASTFFLSFASAATVTKTIPFSVTGSLDNITNTFSYVFNVSDAGMIDATVTWSGGPNNLTVALVKNSTGAIAGENATNSSVIGVSYPTVADNVTSGATWNVKIIDYYSSMSASGNITLTWSALPPSVFTTYSATSITSSSAVLQAAINPSSLSTTWQFVYVNGSENFKNSAGTSTFTLDAFNGTENVTMNATGTASISSLQPGTTYFFRVTAQNDAGSASGNLMSFTTLPLSSTTTTTTAATSATTTTTTVATETTTTETPTETATTEATNETATGADFFVDAFNVLLAIVIGIVIVGAVIYMYLKKWNA